MFNKKIHIITITYNQVIDSVLSHNYDNKEYIIIDGGV